MKTVEASGRTLDAAIQNALKELGLTQDQVDVKVLQEGGFLKSFKVEVTTKPTEEEKIHLFLQTLLNKMGFDNCTVEMSTQDDAIMLNITGEDAHNAIGYRGEVLDALQYLCSLQLNSKQGHFKRIVLDSEGYRAKREKTLQKLALNLEQKVKRTGRAVNLEAMNPYERRIIHTALQNSKFVSTQSEGQGTTRHVVISPKTQSNILNAPNATRKTLNFVYRSDKKRRR